MMDPENISFLGLVGAVFGKKGITDLFQELFGFRDRGIILIKPDKNPSQMIIVQSVAYTNKLG
ncbi:MAG: hypothetical protein NW237_01820 [Cyanobacteriota bacterium]|nr:hypothetical protein [Cyanobacteriota bacterium]